MRQHIGERLGHVVVVLLGNPDNPVRIPFPKGWGQGIHIADDGFRSPLSAEAFTGMIQVFAESSVTAEHGIGRLQQPERIRFLGEFPIAEDDNRFHNQMRVLAISAAEVPCVVR